MVVSGARHFAHGGLVHIGGKVWVGFRHLALPNPALERGSLFQRQAVHGYVVGFEFEGGVHAGAPVVGGLIRQSKHEVEAEVVEAGASGGAYGFFRPCGVVAPAERLQQPVVERLDADAEAVDSGAGELVQLAVGDVTGVGFERDFGVGRDGEGVAYRGQKRGYLAFGQVRRGSAAEEYGSGDRAPERRCPRLDFGLERGQVGGHHRLDARVGVEVAVRALGLAEWDVRVYSDGRDGGGHTLNRMCMTSPSATS